MPSSTRTDRESPKTAEQGPHAGAFDRAAGRPAPNPIIDDSPRVVAQRVQLEAAFGPAAFSPAAHAKPDVPVQRIKKDGKVEPNKYVRNESTETPQAFRERMKLEMATFRESLAHLPDPVPADTADTPSPAKKTPDPVKIESLKRLNARTFAAPTVGISNRPGLGYDAKTIRENHGGLPTGAASLPTGFAPLSIEQSNDQVLVAGEAERVRTARREALARGAVTWQTADGTEVHETSAARQVGDAMRGVDGLFVPGGQDREDDGSAEKTTRSDYETALVTHARTLGLPTLAVCGGSRAFGMAFGAREERLNADEAREHNKKGTGVPAHSISLPNPHTFLGSATRARGVQSDGIDKVNSTHVKVLEMGGDQRLAGVPNLADGAPHLVVSALDPTKKHPEGFETPYGAPQVGVTSHPEAVFGTASGRKNATEQFVNWSNNIFAQYRQSMLTYRARRNLAADFSEKMRAADLTVPTGKGTLAAKVAVAALGKPLTAAPPRTQGVVSTPDGAKDAPSSLSDERASSLLSLAPSIMDDGERSPSALKQTPDTEGASDISRESRHKDAAEHGATSSPTSGNPYPSYGMSEHSGAIVPLPALRSQLSTIKKSLGEEDPEQRQMGLDRLDQMIAHVDWQVAAMEPSASERSFFNDGSQPSSTYPNLAGANVGAYDMWLFFRELMKLRRGD